MQQPTYYIEEEEIILESYLEEPEQEIQAEDGMCLAHLDDEPSRYVTIDIEKLRKAGVPEYIIEMILDNKEELSTLRITLSHRILLPDYKMEIKMPPLDKALYFLYLKHPEGIRFKELSDHRDELLKLYSSIAGRGDLDLIKASVDSLIDPMNNSVNEKCSRIKRVFTKAFSPEIAKNYYIDGKSGEAKTISLDPDMISWD